MEPTTDDEKPDGAASELTDVLDDDSDWMAATCKTVGELRAIIDGLDDSVPIEYDYDAYARFVIFYGGIPRTHKKLFIEHGDDI